MTDNPVPLLASLLRPSDTPPPVLFLGAGASFRSGVPLAAEAVKRIARLAYAKRELGDARPPERVKLTEWEPWLQSFSWFIQGADRLADNFPLVVEHLLIPADFRKRVLVDLMRPTTEISIGYRILANFLMRGLVNTILTTNLDPCLPTVLHDIQPHIRQIHEVNRTAGDYDQFSVFNKCQIVWLHGRPEHYSDKNTPTEITSVAPALISLLRPLLDGAPLIVIGYRGAEPSIMDHVFGQHKDGRLDFPHGIYWCSRQDESPHPHVEALARRIGANFTPLAVADFDALLRALDPELISHERYTAHTPGVGRLQPLAFDEQPVEAASLKDLDLDLALSVLRIYSDRLKRAPVSAEVLPALMREQGLLVGAPAASKVTAAALLLFGRHPQQFFPHAVVSVTQAGKKREIYQGNLIVQHRELLDRLESKDVNPLLKVKGRRHHDERTAYPPRALVELLVNMLVHRDYEVPEPANIEIRPGNGVLFTNPGGLTDRLAERVTIQDDGQFAPSDSITDQRNPSLCDIFFGLSAMERAGTGLIDVRHSMTEHGGDSAFFHHSCAPRFEARVAQPPASGRSRTIARSTLPIGIYLLNHLPFTIIPDTLSVVRLTTSLQDRPPSLSLSQCGTFVHRGTELWSFLSVDRLTTLLAPIVDLAGSRAIPRREVEANPDSRRVLSWLLRKHWEQYLVRFLDDGLVLDVRPKSRAYFEGRERGGRTIVWHGPQRRGNRRAVVKRRRDGPKAWFENEGFGYGIVQIDELWCVRVKPFYMFTGSDARTPLPHFVRTARATSRVKYDRNKNVEADLVFWSSFLAGGNEILNLGHGFVEDLLLDSSFIDVEVSELGMVRNESED